MDLHVDSFQIILVHTKLFIAILYKIAILAFAYFVFALFIMHCLVQWIRFLFLLFSLSTYQVSLNCPPQSMLTLQKSRWHRIPADQFRWNKCHHAYDLLQPEVNLTSLPFSYNSRGRYSQGSLRSWVIEAVLLLVLISYIAKHFKVAKLLRS